MIRELIQVLPDEVILIIAVLYAMVVVAVLSVAVGSTIFAIIHRPMGKHCAKVVGYIASYKFIKKNDGKYPRVTFKPTSEEEDVVAVQRIIESYPITMYPIGTEVEVRYTRKVKSGKYRYRILVEWWAASQKRYMVKFIALAVLSTGILASLIMIW